MTLSKILNYAKAIKKQIYISSTYSVLNKVFDLAPPFLIGLAVDVVVKKEASFLARFGFIDPYEQIIVLAVLTVVVWGLESLFEYLSNVGWRNIAQNLQHILRQDTYNHVQNLDLMYFEDKNSGELISVISDDINQLERFLNDGANTILQVLTTVLVVGSIFFYLAPTVAIYSCLPIPIILFGSFWYQKKLQPLYKKVRAQVGLLNEALVNNFSGISTIKSYTAEKYEENKLMQLSRNYCSANEKAIIVSSAFSPLIRMAVVAGFIATLIIGGRLTIDGSMEVGIYSVLVFMTQRLLWPLTRLGATFDMYQRSMASADRIFKLLCVPINIKSGTEEVKVNKGSVVFKDVSFGYNPDQTVLSNLSFSIESGKTLAIVGSTGSGKSTIIKLLNRFYDISHGQILIDDLDIKQLTLSSLRSSMSLVSQDQYLFYGTVKNNITYGQSNISEDQLIKAANDSESLSFINEMPLGWETLVGERGVKLSGGQQQRLTIARALLKDAPILILDEATSSVDNETEAAIQRAIERASKTKTLIVIAHRLSTIVNADKIIVLDEGRVVQQGSHKDLLKAEGLYQKLWSVQTGSISSDKVTSLN